MGLFSMFTDAMYSAKVAGHLLNLGIDIKKFDKHLNRKLYEMEKSAKDNNSPPEMALCFMAANGKDLPENVLARGMDKANLAQYAAIICTQWAHRGTIRPEKAEFFYICTGTTPTLPRERSPIEDAYNDLMKR